MKLLSWALQRRMIYRGTRFVVIAVVFGPLISGLLISLVAYKPMGPMELLVTEIAFTIGGYYFGVVPAALSSILIVARRWVSVVEALVITAVATFVIAFVFISASSWLSEVPRAAGVGLALALLSIPGAIGAGLLAAWWGAFTPSELHKRAAASSTLD